MLLVTWIYAFRHKQPRVLEEPSSDSTSSNRATVTDKFFENALSDSRFNHAMKNQLDIAAEVNTVINVYMISIIFCLGVDFLRCFLLSYLCLI
jgi:hypothetical protein